MVVPKVLRLPPLEQRKKREFCKFHGFLGHNTSHCVIFRDSVQKALDQGRLKFGDKSRQPMQVDANPLKKADSMYVDIAGVNMVEISEIEPVVTTKTLKVDVKMANEGHDCVDAMVTEDQYAEKIKVVFPKVEEDLIVFDKEAAKNVEGFRPQLKRKGKWTDKRPKFSFDKRSVPHKDTPPTRNQKRGQAKTFTPPCKSPTEQWVFLGGKKSNYISPTSKWVKRATSTNIQNEAPELKKNEASDSKKFAYNNNYKGKYPMTKTQRRRFQRQKKADALKDVTNTDKGKSKQMATFEMIRKPATERIFPPLSIVKENLPVEDEELTSNFIDF